MGFKLHKTTKTLPSGQTAPFVRPIAFCDHCERPILDGTSAVYVFRDLEPGEEGDPSLLPFLLIHGECWLAFNAANPASWQILPKVGTVLHLLSMLWANTGCMPKPPADPEPEEPSEQPILPANGFQA